MALRSTVEQQPPGGHIMRRIRVVLSTLFLAIALVTSGLSAPVASAEVDVYTTPGEHTVNGRQWRTWCEPYSQTVRCRTEIWATTVIRSGGSYYNRTWWTFNNLTYLSSPPSLWVGNPLASPGEHRLSGRTWETECYTPRTGNGCRAYLWTDVVAAHKSGSGYRYQSERTLVFNNIVQFGALRTDLAELVKWRPKNTTPPGPPSPSQPPAPANYNISKGPNSTNRVTLTFDDCPKSLSAFKTTVLAAEEAGIALAVLPTGDCIRAGKIDTSFAREHGHYVFNHSISHPDLTTLSYAGVVKQLGAPGVVTTYGRPPYGAWNSTVKKAYDAVGMKIWIWNVDTNDWKGKSQSEVVNYVVANAKAGNSVLMHMQWNGFSGSALRAMKSGLAAKGISVCRNQGATTPVKPAAMNC
ncbi:polysaccharide deacetylase family protein [Tessaracoccus antarcticus]|uniref:Polysaccharide deacetylase family protein n=1 Tax=Tessaracoccus antarcticus TaxID=2479848 RepID=A0A3M0GA18_9ACTN|nr:polysaccharide deacetylase family protein [Tessaracoccus antarcticus]RMB61845.1 polysaccharide deacetylase family protein [Tessaracoccus antarcticus]